MKRKRSWHCNVSSKVSTILTTPTRQFPVTNACLHLPTGSNRIDLGACSSSNGMKQKSKKALLLLPGSDLSAVSSQELQALEKSTFMEVPLVANQSVVTTGQVILHKAICMPAYMYETNAASRASLQGCKSTAMPLLFTVGGQWPNLCTASNASHLSICKQLGEMCESPMTLEPRAAQHCMAPCLTDCSRAGARKGLHLL